MTFHRPRDPSDVAAEIDAHLRHEIDRWREHGLSAEEAERAARRAFGNVTLVEERLYDAGRWRWWDRLGQDVRYACRLLAKNWTLTTIVVLTLALGIGANSVIFSVVRAVVLRPLPFRDPDQLVQLWESSSRSGGEADWVTFPNFRDWLRDSQAFESIAAYRFALLTVTGTTEPESVLGLEVTDRLFAVLGVSPQVGRTFLPGADAPGGEAVVVISHTWWIQRFHMDPAVVSTPLTIDGRSYTVIGVMPPSFRFPVALPGENMVAPIDLWIPMRRTPDLEQRASHNFWAIGRLKAGVTLERARVEMNTIAARLAQQYPGTNKDFGVSVARLQDHLTETIRPALLVLLAAVGVVLLLACANIATLLLSRAESRRREMAIRQALGADRGRLIRQTLTETLVLALLGGVAGLLVAYIGTPLVRTFGPANIPRFQESAVDLQVWIFTASVALGSGVLCGLAPALLAPFARIAESLKEAGGRATSGRLNLFVRDVFVAVEMAFAVMLLIAAGLLIRSFAYVMRLDRGFQSAQVLTTIVTLPPTRYAQPSQQVAFFEELLRRIRTVPGVRSAAVSNSVPFTGINDQGGFRIEGRPAPPPGEDAPQGNRPRVSGGYFETMGIRLLDGRLFDERDQSDSALVAIISDVAARTYWPDENPLGRRVSINALKDQRVWRQIVGVVHGTRHFGLEAPQKAELYVPHTQAPSPGMVLVVRAWSDPTGVIASIRHEMAAVDPAVAGFAFQRLDDLLSNAESRRRFETLLLTAFAGLAALLAAIGVYGVLAYIVAQRTREIGVRLALGAEPRDVVSMVLRRGLSVSGAGAGLGFAGALAFRRLVASLVVGVSPVDVVTWIGVAAVLITIAGVSSYVPGRRAARVDPLIALREE
jgi:putative ABC transport system permease protein